MYAARHSHIISMLIAARADVNVSSTDTRVIGHSVVHGNVDSVRVLIAAGADIHATNSKGEAAIHLAAFFGRDDVMALLIGAGANIDMVCSSNGKTPIYVAVAQGHHAIVRRLLAAGARVADPVALLAAAAASESADMASMLFDAVAKSGAPVASDAVGGGAVAIKRR
jgi:ankyrin repeat protein